MRTKLAAARAYLEVAPQVVNVRADAAVEPVDSRLPATPADPDALEDLSKRYGLGSPVRRLQTALAEKA
jgi:hypothetical protein